MSPLLILVIGIVFVVVAITKFKIHPFFALLVAAVLVGVLPARKTALSEFIAECCDASAENAEKEVSARILYEGYRTWHGEEPLSEEEFGRELVNQGFERLERDGEVFWRGLEWEGIKSGVTLAIEATTGAFGSLAGKIGIVIAMAAVIGQCLMESGAADKITRRLLAFLGEKRANVALLGSGYFLSVPVFFDTVFFLLVPLARALSVRTGRNFLLYVMAICAGGAVTHSLVPPTPGPLIMVEELGMDLGVAIGGGFLLGLPAAILGGLWLPRILNRKLDIPLRDAAGSTRKDLEAVVNTPEDELPGFLGSVAPVALPVILIAGHSIVDVLMGRSDEPFWSLYTLTSLLGDKHFALFLGMAIALWVLARQKKYSLSRLSEAIEPGLMAAGVIILITCAGGAFGGMLRVSGIKGQIEGWTQQGISPMWLIVLAWGVAAVMKIAQGSGTVAMITASSIMGAVVEGVDLPYHVIYVFAAIAFGSKFISWMNDSGFWVVCKMSGFTQAETLKTWTVMLGFMGVVGLLEVLVLSRILPFV